MLKRSKGHKIVVYRKYPILHFDFKMKTTYL